MRLLRRCKRVRAEVERQWENDLGSLQSRSDQPHTIGCHLSARGLWSSLVAPWALVLSSAEWAEPRIASLCRAVAERKWKQDHKNVQCLG